MKIRCVDATDEWGNVSSVVLDHVSFVHPPFQEGDGSWSLPLQVDKTTMYVGPFVAVEAVEVWRDMYFDRLPI